MHSSNLFFLFGIFLIQSNSVQAKKKPSDFFTICKKSDPKLGECILKSAEIARPKLLKGIPELKMIPLSPFFVPKMSMEQGQNNFKLSLVLSNLKIKGLETTEYKSATVSEDLKWMNFSSTVKVMQMEGEYAMDGQILVIPVKGDGKVNFTFSDVTINSNLLMEFYEKNGEKYMKCKEFKISIDPKQAKSEFTNLFNGDKNLGESANKFFNENWRETFDTYRELPEEAFGELFKEYVNMAFTLHPMKEWIKD